MSEKFKTPEQGPEPNEVEKNLAEAMTEALSKGDIVRFDEIADLAGDRDEIIREADILNRNNTVQETEKKEDAASTSDLIREMEESFQSLTEKEERVEKLGATEALQKLYEHFGDESNPFYTNTKKGSGREFFFRVIQEEHPEFKVEVRDDAKYPETKEPLEDHVAVYVKPYEGKRRDLVEIQRDPIIDILTSEILTREYFDRAKEMEKNGDLPSGITKRIIARRYKKNIESYEKTGWMEGVYDEEARLRFLGDVEPLSDEELRALMSEAVRKAIAKKERG